MNTLTARCKHCREVFLRRIDRCPSCYQRTTFGTRQLYLKIVALASFATALLWTAYVMATAGALP